MPRRRLRRTFSACLFLAFVVVCVCPSTAQTPAAAHQKQFAPQQLIEDVDFYVKTLEETHIDPFVHISQKEFRARADGIKSRVAKQGAMTQQEFWLLFAPLVSSVQDGHTVVVEPRFFIPNNPTKYLPVRAAYLNGELVVQHSVADEKVAKGSVITSVNGLKGADVIRKLSLYVFGVEKERTRGAAEWLWVGAAEVLGRPETFALTFNDGTRAEVRGLTASEIISRERAANFNPTPGRDSPLELKFLEGDIAYLNSTTFSHDLEKFRGLLKDIFTRIKESGAKSLVIDVRGNTGGHSALGDALLDMFNARPYKTYTMSWKRSLQYAEMMKRDGAKIPDHYSDLKPGGVYVSKPSTVRPPANPLRFGGRVYVLSGRRTFSSAQMFLGLIKDNKLARVVGEETDTPACFPGELYAFNLPNSRLRVTSSVKYWVPPGGCKGARGVVPDVPVTERLGDYLTGRDRILEEAIKLIKAAGG
jgi:hypothetical protein